MSHYEPGRDCGQDVQGLSWAQKTHQRQREQSSPGLLSADYLWESVIQNRTPWIWGRTYIQEISINCCTCNYKLSPILNIKLS